MRVPRGSIGRSFLGLVLAVLAVPSFALALPSGDWSAPPPTTVSDLPGRVTEAEVVIDPAGRTIASWIQEDQGGLGKVYASVSGPGGGSWSAPQLVFDPQVAIDPGLDMAVAPDGTVTVVWASSHVTEAINPALWQATKPKGTTNFSAATRVSEVGNFGSEPKVVFGSANQAVITWQRETFLNADMAEVFLRPAGGSFSFSARFGSIAIETVVDPQVAIGKKGEIIVVWEKTDTLSDSGTVIQRAVRPAGESEWKGPFDMTSPDQGAASPFVAMEPGGRATVTFISASVEQSGLLQRTRAAGSSSFQSARFVSASGVEVTGYNLAMGPDGTVAAAWSQGYPETSAFSSFRYPNRSSFASPQLIPASTELYQGPAVAVGGARQVFVAFSAFPGPFAVPEVAMKPWDSNVFEPARPLNDSSNDAFVEDVAAGQDGWATVAFTRLTGPTSAQLEEGSFKTERAGRLGVAWKWNRKKGILTGTFTRPAFRNLRYSISATRGKLIAKGGCSTSYTPKRSQATCRIRLRKKGTWKVTVEERQYQYGWSTVEKTVRR